MKRTLKFLILFVVAQLIMLSGTWQSPATAAQPSSSSGGLWQNLVGGFRTLFEEQANPAAGDGNTDAADADAPGFDATDGGTDHDCDPDAADAAGCGCPDGSDVDALDCTFDGDGDGDGPVDGVDGPGVDSTDSTDGGDDLAELIALLKILIGLIITLLLTLFS